MNDINISEFKAKCLAILEEVERTGQPVTIYKRGRVIAQVVPAVPRDEGYPQDRLKGTVKTLGDIISPLGDSWDALTS